MPQHRSHPLVRNALLLALTIPVLGACAWLRPTDGSRSYHFPYKPDVVQGNVVTQEQVALLRKGMTREQALTLLGTPLMQHAFRADRWDYLFSLDSQDSKPVRARLSLFFTGDALERFDTQTLPTQQQFVESIAREPLPGQMPPLDMTPAQLEAARKKAESQPSDAASSLPPQPLGPDRAYPPLPDTP